MRSKTNYHKRYYLTGVSAAKNASFCAIYIQKQTVYQDRLGTNIGKTQQRDRFYRDKLVGQQSDTGRIHSAARTVLTNVNRDVGPDDGGFVLVPASHKQLYPVPRPTHTSMDLDLVRHLEVKAVRLRLRLHTCTYTATCIMIAQMLQFSCCFALL